MTFESALNYLWPQGDKHIPGLKQGIIDTSRDVFERFGLDSPLVIAHAMAQFSQECGAGLEVVENLSYSTPKRIAEVWPSRFSVASAVPYVRNPKALADKVYNGRMGNRPGSDDGYNYRGRGGAQTTSREGYDALGKKLGVDLLTNPDTVNDQNYFLECAVADFVICGCLPFAKRDDVRGVTHHLNGGYTNLADRTAWLARWKKALGVGDAVPTPAEAGLGVGSQGWEVEAAQKRLIALGYPVGKADAGYDASTRAAVLALQADNGLPTTGRIDDATKEALSSAPPKPIAEARATATEADVRATGSGTIADADKLVTGAKIAGTMAGAEGVHKSGWLDGLTDNLSAFKEVSEGLSDVLTFVEGHLWVVLLVGAGVALWFGRSIIARRIADHRAGLNMGR